MKGSCLCGAVSFEISGDVATIYQCHCSLCRKVSGSSSNSALIVAADQFEWISGQNSINKYTTETGFKSEFCKGCGSPVPNKSSGGDTYWVPAGLLGESTQTSISAHVYVDSRADWDTAFLSDDVAKYPTMPGDK